MLTALLTDDDAIFSLDRHDPANRVYREDSEQPSAACETETKMHKTKQNAGGNRHVVVLWGESYSTTFRLAYDRRKKTFDKFRPGKGLRRLRSDLTNGGDGQPPVPAGTTTDTQPFPTPAEDYAKVAAALNINSTAEVPPARRGRTMTVRRQLARQLA